MTQIDLVVFAVLLVIGQMCYVWATYQLNLSKMDGPGFVPLFQKQLARHIARLPQSILDVCNESELMAMMEKDVNALNDVVGAWFDLCSSVLEIVILVPVLFLLS